MPKVKPIYIHSFVHGSDIRFEHEYACNVYADGHFETTIPDELVDEFRTVHPKLEIYENRNGKKFISTASRAHAGDLCKQHADWRVRCTETRELRIYYNFHTTASFARSKNGAIYPNGHLAGEGYKWNENTSQLSGPSTHFSYGLGATVYEAITRVTADGQKSTQLRRPEERDAETLRLDAFRCAVDPGNRFRSAPTKWMPYTKERATWFADRLQEQCERADALDRYMQEGLKGKIDADIPIWSNTKDG